MPEMVMAPPRDLPKLQTEISSVHTECGACLPAWMLKQGCIWTSRGVTHKQRHNTGTAHVTPVVRRPDGVQQLERDRHGNVRIRQSAADQVAPAARLDRRTELLQDSHGLAHAARVGPCSRCASTQSSCMAVISLEWQACMLGSPPAGLSQATGAVGCPSRCGGGCRRWVRIRRARGRRMRRDASWRAPSPWSRLCPCICPGSQRSSACR